MTCILINGSDKKLGWALASQHEKARLWPNIWDHKMLLTQWIMIMWEVYKLQVEGMPLATNNMNPYSGHCVS